MAKTTYDLNAVKIILAGVEITGAADGDKITITATGDLWSTKRGADGEVTRSRINNNGAEVTLNLMQTSPVNDELQAIKEVDKKGGRGAFSLLVIDKFGTSRYFSRYCWFKKEPDTKFAAEADARAWPIECAEMEFQHGGNNEIVTI